jgi:hypothetical protein
MNYRIDKNRLLGVLEGWNRFLKRRVHLIACGGTAMTLAGVKISTKDVDFIVPEIKEYDYLIKQLASLGYELVTGSGWKRPGEVIRYDIFRGNRIHTTELLESPLKEGGHAILKKYTYLYIGILNDYDLIASKLMRGAAVDFEDCLELVKAHRAEIDIQRIIRHFHEIVSYDVAQDRLRPNIDRFLELLREKRLYD